MNELRDQSKQLLEIAKTGVEQAKVEAKLKGINGIEIEVTTIWMITNQQAKFVTLVPKRSSDRE